MTLLEKLQNKMQIVSVFDTCLEMINHGSPTRAIRAFMQIAVWAYGLDDILHTAEYYTDYKPLLKYL